MDQVRNNEIVIDDSNFQEHVETVMDGKVMCRGYVERDWSKFPAGSMGGQIYNPNKIPLIPRNEWSSRIKDKIQSKTQTSDLRLRGNKGNPIESINQTQSNYCWSHSTTQTVICNRCVSNQPYVPLSAYAVASTIKRGANEGGWCGLSMKFAVEKGIPEQRLWPQGQFRAPSNLDEVWKNAEMYKVDEGYIDIDAAVYDQNMTFDQVATLLLMNIPCAVDFNWWAHSVCGVDLVELDSSLQLSDKNRWGIRIWNSWGDSWSDRGMGILKGSKAIPNGAVACLSVPAFAA